MRISTGERWFYRINNLILGLAALTCLLPMLNLLAVSLSGNRAVMSGEVGIWPVEFTAASYEALASGSPILSAFGNSVLLTVVGIALSMLFTLLAAYPLSRRAFYLRKPITLAIVFTMLFTGGIIPHYLLVDSLGLVNTYWALWLPALVSPFNMLIMKNYFEQLPDEMEEAARIDGCGEFAFITKIVLPLSVPMLATIALFYGVNLWNSFFQVLIYINDTDKYNLTVLVQQMVRSTSVLLEYTSLQPEEMNQLPPEGVKAAGVIVLLLPMLIVYPFIQKYFVKGVMIGAIKG
ncbi:MAG: carbohydrate transporter permease [Paenibacillus sp.]|jgi:putative aldouronate transport system permease protein|nr:carbohydrate transporter permease [Paenibacillus sp.]